MFVNLVLEMEPVSTVPSPVMQSMRSRRGPPKACLFVANIPAPVSEEQIVDTFKTFGEIARVTIPRNRPHFAFVQFVKPESVDAAMAAPVIIAGQRLRLERSKSNSTLFIARMSYSVTPEKLQEICEKFGPVEKVTIIMNYETKTSKGCGFVKFVFREDALACLTHAQQSSRFGEESHKWVVEWALSTDDQMDTQTIFIGGLEKDHVSEALLREKFGAYGAIEKISIVNRGDMEGPAFAFIQFEKSGSAAAAIAKEDRTEWLGGNIRVQFSESTEMKNRKRAHMLESMAQYLVPIPSFSQNYVPSAGNPEYAMMAPAIPYRKGANRQNPREFVPMPVPYYGQDVCPVYVQVPVYQPPPHEGLLQHRNVQDMSTPSSRRVVVE